jgi:vacuolar-type H+-ATPase subunit E/Vma4
MPLDTILQALEAEAERLVAEIDQAAQVEVERILTQAQAKAAGVRQKHLTAIEAPLRAERARLLNRAKLTRLQLVLGTREDLITAALEAAARRLAALTSSQAYAGWLRKLTQEAVAALGLNNLTLHVQDSDLALMNRLVQELGFSATVTGDLELAAELERELGGVVVTTPDGRISLVNTLGVRLQRVAALYRARIAELLFEDQQEA